MSNPTEATLALIACFVWQSSAVAADVLFEDNFDAGLSPKWQMKGLDPDDFRLRDGALELRVKPLGPNDERPMLKVDLPFTTADTVEASVEVTVVGGNALERNDEAGLLLTDAHGVAFSVRKTNINGYLLLAPGEPEFIGEPGEEGDPANYAVKFWPAEPAYGPLRVVVRAHNAYFQVGPSSRGEYKSLFHSAITEAAQGLGFALTANGNQAKAERWARFDNFRVTRP